MNSSLKKHIIQIFSALFYNKSFTAKKIILVTSFGIVTGKPVIRSLGPEFGQKKISSLEAKQVMQFFAEKGAKSYYGDLNSNNETISENDCYLLLEDAEIQNSAFSTLSMPSLLVFYDQIIALSIDKM